MHPRVSVADGAAESYIKNHVNKVHATHVLLYNIGQVAEQPTCGTVPKTLDWSDRLLPEPCPPSIRAVVERYLRLRLDAKFDRPQTVRLARESLRRFINWPCGCRVRHIRAHCHRRPLSPGPPAPWRYQCSAVARAGKPVCVILAGLTTATVVWRCRCRRRRCHPRNRRGPQGAKQPVAGWDRRISKLGSALLKSSGADARIVSMVHTDGFE